MYEIGPKVPFLGNGKDYLTCQRRDELQIVITIGLNIFEVGSLVVFGNVAVAGRLDRERQGDGGIGRVPGFSSSSINVPSRSLVASVFRSFSNRLKAVSTCFS